MRRRLWGGSDNSWLWDLRLRGWSRSWRSISSVWFRCRWAITSGRSCRWAVPSGRSCRWAVPSGCRWSISCRRSSCGRSIPSVRSWCRRTIASASGRTIASASGRTITSSSGRTIASASGWTISGRLATTRIRWCRRRCTILSRPGRSVCRLGCSIRGCTIGGPRAIGRWTVGWP